MRKKKNKRRGEKEKRGRKGDKMDWMGKTILKEE